MYALVVESLGMELSGELDLHGLLGKYPSLYHTLLYGFRRWHS